MFVESYPTDLSNINTFCYKNNFGHVRLFDKSSQAFVSYIVKYAFLVVEIFDGKFYF